MRKTLLALAATAAATLAFSAPAEARQGCGVGGHRGPAGHCRDNRGPGYGNRGPTLVIGNFYRGHGYWDGHRYYQQRYRYRNGWRYR